MNIYLIIIFLRSTSKTSRTESGYSSERGSAGSRSGERKSRKDKHLVLCGCIDKFKIHKHLQNLSSSNDFSSTSM